MSQGFFAAASTSCTQRASALQLDESRFAPCHAVKYAAPPTPGNVIQLGEAVAVRLNSDIRKAARAVGLGLLTEAIGAMSQIDVAAMLDMSRGDVGKMFIGLKPWPIEAFVLVAERAPDVAVEVVLAYAKLLPTEQLRRSIERLQEMLKKREKES
jgi:hypothetical protein